MTIPHSIRCLCGAVNLTLTGQPAARANCHCGSCRDFYATSMFSATAWQAEQVTIAGGSVVVFPHPTRQLKRAFCPACGETVFGVNRLGMRVIPNGVTSRATGGELPEELRPIMHLFYRSRIVDIADDLPKYLDGWDGPTL